MKNAMGYLACGLIAVFVSYFINASGGLLLLELLTLGFLLSSLIYILSQRKISAAVRTVTEVAAKNDKLEIELVLSSTIFPLPTAMAEITLQATDNLRIVGEPKFRALVMSKEPTVIRVPVETVYCGVGAVSIKSLVLHDYLGIADKDITASLPGGAAYIKVLPNIPETGGQQEILRATAENSAYDEDNESETNETSLTPTGFPGFEHRDYIPGDSLKRINWKLSSKKDELMVRLDEKVSASSQIFVLDIPQGDLFNGIYMKNIDNIVEASLAMLDMLVRQGYESEFNYCIGGDWRKAEISQLGDILLLQEDLAGIRVTEDKDRFAFGALNQNTMPICFSACMADMQAQLQYLLEKVGGSFVFTKNSGIEKVAENVWHVDENMEFERLG